MKWLPWILVFLLAVILLLRNYTEMQVNERIIHDTVVKYDTIRDSVPYPMFTYIYKYDTAYFPIFVDSSTVGHNPVDSVPVVIPVERKEYRTEDYQAVISGYRPNLDLIEVFQKTQTITVTPKTKRWGLGLQAGYGVSGGWYVGVGISYNIWQW